MRYPAPDETNQQVLHEKDDIYTLPKSFMKRKKIFILKKGKCHLDLPLNPVLEVLVQLA